MGNTAHASVATVMQHGNLIKPTSYNSGNSNTQLNTEKFILFFGYLQLKTIRPDDIIHRTSYTLIVHQPQGAVSTIQFSIASMTRGVQRRNGLMVLCHVSCLMTRLNFFGSFFDSSYDSFYDSFDVGTFSTKLITNCVKSMAVISRNRLWDKFAIAWYYSLLSFK